MMTNLNALVPKNSNNDEWGFRRYDTSGANFCPHYMLKSWYTHTVESNEAVEIYKETGKFDQSQIEIAISKIHAILSVFLQYGFVDDKKIKERMNDHVIFGYSNVIDK